MSGLRIEGNTSGRVAAVDAGGNLQVAFSNDPAYIGGVKFATENDAGTVTGSPKIMYPQTSSDYRLRIGTDTILFSDTFNATTQNTSIWLHYFSTMTVAQSGGFAVFNNNLTTTTTTGCSLQTFRTLSLVPGATLTLEFTGNLSTTPKANQVFEAGLFKPAATPTTAPTDGVFFRIDFNVTPRLQGVYVYNGGAEQTIDLSAAFAIINGNADWLVTVDNNEINWWVNDILIGTQTVLASYGAPFQSTALPIGMQQRNSGAVGSSGMQVKIASVVASIDDMHTVKPWPHQMCGFDLMASQGQNGGTMGSTSLMTTSLNPTPAAITNTTASATFTGLGGQFPVNPTLTAGTDGILCSYANPLGAVGQTPRVLYITGVTIQSIVTTVLANTTPLVIAYSLAYGHTTVSLAQAETTTFQTATTKAARRIPLGMEGFAINAAVGVTSGQGVRLRFQTPVVVNPGEFVAIAAKNLVGVTTSGVLTSLVTFNGYFE